jgi:hypothetical protein
VNEDYDSMAGDFIRLGFLSPGTDVRPIVPALENIWQDARCVLYTGSHTTALAW